MSSSNARYSAMPCDPWAWAVGPTARSGAGGHVGGEDIVRVAVEVFAGSTWWTRLFQLSECVSLTGVLKGRFDVFGGGWFAAAVVGGGGGPVARGGGVAGGRDPDVGAGAPGERLGGEIRGAG